MQSLQAIYAWTYIKPQCLDVFLSAFHRRHHPAAYRCTTHPPRPPSPQLGLRTWGLCWMMWPRDGPLSGSFWRALFVCLHCVNGTIGMTRASRCHGSAEKGIIETRFGATALIMTSALLPLQPLARLLSLSLSVCRCSACLVHYPSSADGC